MDQHYAFPNSVSKLLLLEEHFMMTSSVNCVIITKCKTLPTFFANYSYPFFCTLDKVFTFPGLKMYQYSETFLNFVDNSRLFKNTIQKRHTVDCLL